MGAHQPQLDVDEGPSVLTDTLAVVDAAPYCSLLVCLCRPVAAVALQLPTDRRFVPLHELGNAAAVMSCLLQYVDLESFVLG